MQLLHADNAASMCSVIMHPSTYLPCRCCCALQESIWKWETHSPGTIHCSEKHHTCNPASPESRCRVDSTCVEGWATSTELLSGGHSHVTCSSSAVSTQQAFIAVSYLCKGLNGIPPSSVSLPLGNHLWCQTSSYMQFLGVLHMEVEGTVTHQATNCM